MNTLIHADIFFFVATIIVIILGVLLVIALVYVIKILRNVQQVSDNIKKGDFIKRYSMKLFGVIGDFWKRSSSKKK